MSLSKMLYLVVFFFLMSFCKENNHKSNKSINITNQQLNLLPISNIGKYLVMEGDIGGKAATLNIIFNTGNSLFPVLGCIYYLDNSLPEIFVSSLPFTEFKIKDVSNGLQIFHIASINENEIAGKLEQGKILNNFHFKKNNNIPLPQFKYFFTETSHKIRFRKDSGLTNNAFLNLCLPYLPNPSNRKEAFINQAIVKSTFGYNIDNIMHNTKEIFAKDYDLLKRLPHENAYREYYTILTYNSDSLLSIFSISITDCFRKQSSFGYGKSFDLRHLKEIKFYDIFRKETKNDLTEIVKSRFFAQIDSSKRELIDKNGLKDDFLKEFSIDNFMLSPHGIRFIHYTNELRKVQSPRGYEFDFDFKQLKKYLRNDAIFYINQK